MKSFLSLSRTQIDTVHYTAINITFLGFSQPSQLNYKIYDTSFHFFNYSFLAIIKLLCSAKNTPVYGSTADKCCSWQLLGFRSTLPLLYIPSKLCLVKCMTLFRQLGVLSIKIHRKSEFTQTLNIQRMSLGSTLCTQPTFSRRKGKQLNIKNPLMSFESIYRGKIVSMSLQGVI